MKDQFIKSEIQNKINLYFDNALNKEDEIELMKNVKENPKVEALLNAEKAFRLKIKDSFSRNIASPKLVDAVRNQIDTI